MPIKRRAAKIREELSEAQRAFLLDEELPEGLGFAEKMRFVWLRDASRDPPGFGAGEVGAARSMPDASPDARELVARFGAEVLQGWDRPEPPSWVRRFGGKWRGGPLSDRPA